MKLEKIKTTKEAKEMKKKNSERLTRRQVIAGTTTALAGLAASAGVSATPSPENKPLVTKEELREWTKDFYEGIEKGDSLIKCLSTATQKQKNKDFQKVTLDVQNRVAKGEMLSRAMAMHPTVFDEKYVVTVRFGEIYGELDVTLKKWLDSRQ
jgi:type II secretory pathway component PulF